MRNGKRVIKFDTLPQYVIIIYRGEKAVTAEELYKKVNKAIDRGNNVEIRKGKDGNLVVYEVKKNIVTC